MNEHDLKNCLDHIQLPEASKEKMIQNLEKINTEEYVFDVEPGHVPVIRYLFTALAACAVIAVSTAGLYNIAMQKDFNPGSAIEMRSISFEEMQASASEVFAHLGDQRTYYIYEPVLDGNASDLNHVFKDNQEMNSRAWGFSGENAETFFPDSFEYFSISKETQNQIAELYSSLDWEHRITQYSFSHDYGNEFHMIFEYDHVYYDVKTTKADDGQVYVLWICITSGDCLGYTIAVQADDAFYEEVKTLLDENGLFYYTINMSYGDIMYGGLDQIISDMFDPQKSLMSGLAEIDEIMSDAYFITPDSGTQYFNISDENMQKFSKLLMHTLISNVYNIQFDYLTGGHDTFQMFLSNHCYFTVYRDPDGRGNIVITNLPYSSGGCCLSKVDAAVMDELCSYLEPDQYFDTDYQNPETLRRQPGIEEELMNQMFPEKSAPFGDVSQADVTLIFPEYAPCYVIPTEEQKSQLADLLNQFDYEIINKNHDYGQFFSLYLNHGESWKQIKFYLEGYISWEEDEKTYIYEATELVNEIQNLFVPAAVVYEEDENGELNEIQIDYSGEYDISEYEKILQEFNQEYDTPFGIKIIPEGENTDASYAFRMTKFLSKTPEEFRQQLLDAYHTWLEDEKNAMPSENKIDTFPAEN